MSALFNFHSFLTVILLGICACTYFKMQFPAVLEQRTGFRGFFWKAARIERRVGKKPYLHLGYHGFVFYVSLCFCKKKKIPFYFWLHVIDALKISPFVNLSCIAIFLINQFVNPSPILTYQTIVSCTCTFLPLNKKDMDS
ncbi:uncharacterized protein LOC107625085 isoform X1 [Arachis ipaensis]|uniref:uncharacterized protein LOC107625085 isoform X1 n=1 Tax=Arachis ipaensis TaxID=130454 RepID=UPI0007AEEB47|nr:uncharacterized protein LOC107625085 isoform X1 [Arachis ipaensis]XP_025632556.1 uncharacterized protein LOC112727126 isoform X1 [Arachis hypogaea]